MSTHAFNKMFQMFIWVLVFGKIMNNVITVSVDINS